MDETVYLDYAATTPTDTEVVKAMLPYFSDKFGNPSSLYSCGRIAKAAIDKARGQIAQLIGAQVEEIVFTSSGSESDNLALKGVAFANKAKGNQIITSSVEHHAILEACHFLEQEGFEVIYLPVDKFGLVPLQEIKRAITSKTILISIMHANNEIGTVQPIAEIGRIAREAGIYFHTDAVQTVGHLPIVVNDFKIDLLSASAHKFYGPKGVGFLYVRKGTRLTPLIHGGDQENRRRASTENVPGIVGIGKAAELAQLEMGHEAERLILLRDLFIEGLLARIDRANLNGHPQHRLPNNINITFEYVEGESVIVDLDRRGICASTRSACNSSSTESSHVLRALGIPPEQANGSIRFSLGKWTTESDINRVLKVMPEIVARLRDKSPLYLRNKLPR